MSDIEKKEYKYGFKDEIKEIFKTEKGINEKVIKAISKMKKEPEWMLKFRLDSFAKFKKQKMPSFGVDLSSLDFSDYTYFIKSFDHVAKNWEDVPSKIKNTFDKLGINEAEQKFLSGVATQYESEVVYHSMLKEVEEKGIIFTDTDSALKEHPEIFKKYFSKLVANDDNKFASLNSSVWSGGSFIYVPPNTKLDKPLQSYFRINANKMGQFERTLIIVGENSQIHYVEGCSAPIYSDSSLHAAVVEIFVEENAKCRYTTIQNWSNNIINLVTKRAHLEKDATMEWIDGNIGSGKNMKYPTCILKGDNSRAICNTIAFSGEGQNQDTGAKMIHLGNNTFSSVVSKSIGQKGGITNYRGLIYIDKNANNSRSKIECDTLLLDKKSTSKTIPTNKVYNKTSILEHEASVSKISEEELFYLMSRGLDKEKAVEMIVMGFIDPFTKELPMEYAVELNQLLKLEMEGSIG